MTRVAIFESQAISRAGGTSLAIDRERLAERTMLPPIGRSIRLAMREERINHTDFFALACHHVDRIVQKGIANRSGWLGHENARLWLLPHQHRQRADMIEMSVRKQKSIDFLAGEVSEQRQGRFALLLRMHAAIEHDPLLARTQIVTIGADLRPTRQIDELQNRAPL